MFDLLQHPPHSPERAGIGATVSLVAHAALLLLLAVGTGQAVRQAEESRESMIEMAIKFLLPPDKAGAPEERRAQWASQRRGGVQSTDFSPTSVTPAAKSDGGAAPQDVDGSAPVTLSEAASAENAFTLMDVDSAAMRDPESAAPAYPAVLQAQGVEGMAIVRFVVDTNGRADPASFSLVESNHRLFTDAVLDALPRMKFRPAQIGALKVRQLVEIPFAFRIIRRAEPAAAPATKKP